MSVRAVIIRNPNAGRRHNHGDLSPALEVLHDAGWTFRVEDTQARGDAIELARLAAESGADAVLVAGGDGTVNEAIQGLAGSDTAFGYLPYGTVNVWARELGIPTDLREAALALLDGRNERVDLGMAGDRYFLLMAGVGFDAYVLRRARSFEQFKHRFGVLPYVASGLSAAPLYRGADIELRYDGLIRKVQALMIVVGNTRLYAGHLQITPNAVANDGWLDLSIVKGRGPLSFARQSIPLLLSGRIKGWEFESIRVQSLQVSSDEALPVQVDGELVGSTPVTFTVAPRALCAIVPPGFASNLIA